MLNISGQYNINLQVEEMNFMNGKINLRIYKIVKLSRIIRSQNVFDQYGNRTAIAGGVTPMSFESAEIDSNFGETQPGEKTRIGKGVKFVAKRMNSDMFEDARPEDKAVDHNDIQFQGNEGENEGRNGNFNVYESSNAGSSESGGHSQSAQLISFKKQISTREMPASIIKLNRLVLAIVLVIMAVVIFDTAQNYQYYQFSNQCQQIMQNLYQKNYLIGKISANIIAMGAINMGF